MQKKINECLQHRVANMGLTDFEKRTMLENITNEAFHKKHQFTKMTVVIAIMLGALVLAGFGYAFTRGYIPNFFKSSNSIEGTTTAISLYEKYKASGKLDQFASQLSPGQIGTTTYQTLGGSLDVIIMRGDTLDVVLPFLHGEEPNSSVFYYHDQNKKVSGALTHNLIGKDMKFYEKLIDDGNFVVGLPSSKYQFNSIYTHTDNINSMDYISRIEYTMSGNQNISLDYHQSSTIYRDLEKVRAEDIIINGRKFIFATNDYAFEHIKEIYYFFENENENEHLHYSNVMISGYFTMEEAKEIAADLEIFNESELPISGVDKDEALQFLLSFPDVVIKENSDQIIQNLRGIGKQEEGVVWEINNRSICTQYGNPYQVVVEYKGMVYDEAAANARHQPLPFEQFSWFPKQLLKSVVSYYDSTAYKFGEGDNYTEYPYCHIAPLEEELQAETELDMLIGSHFFLTTDCHIVKKDGMMYIISKFDENTVDIGAIAEYEKQYYYYRLSMPAEWLIGTSEEDWWM